jgi:ABC-type multidrug transport system fused ATPase/permease subunit
MAIRSSRAADRAFVPVTHRLTNATVADKIDVLDNGRLG